MRTLLLIVGLAGCNGGGDTDSDSGTPDPDGPIHITGQISPEFTEARRDGHLPVDRVVAIPNVDGNMDEGIIASAIVFELGDDGLFDIEVSTDLDWILLLEASTGTTGEERLRGFVTMGGASGSMLSFPIDEATADVPLGMIEPGADGDAVTETTIAEASASFSLTTETLETLAQFDDTYRLFGNAWVNHDAEAGTDWILTTNGNWRIGFNRLETFVGDAHDMQWEGFSFTVQTNDPRASYVNLCGMSADLAITPVHASMDISHIHNIYTPFRNEGMLPRPDDEWVCTGEHMILTGNPDQVNIGVPAETLAIRANFPGWWTYDVDGERVADIDMTSATPLAGEGPNVPIPLVELIQAPDGEIVAMTLTWHAYDPDTKTFSEIPSTDLEHLLTTLNIMDIHFDVAEDGIPTQLTSADWNTTIDLDGVVGNPLESLAISYQLGPIRHHFVYTQQQFCGDGVVNSDDEERCDRSDLQDETCETLGFDGGGVLECRGYCQYNTRRCLTSHQDAEWIEVDPPDSLHQSGQVTSLADGRVLVTGGSNAGVYTDSAELFDPVSRTWSEVGPMSMTHAAHTATLLADGRVLLVGGRVEGTNDALDTAEIYDPATGSWTLTAPMAGPRMSHAAAALPDGRLLVTGGQTATTGVPTLGTAELWDPTTELWSSAMDLPAPRRGHASFEFDGNILAAGGSDGSDSVLPFDFYLPTNNEWYTFFEELPRGRSIATTHYSPTRQITVLVGGTCDGQNPCGIWQHEPLAAQVVEAWGISEFQDFKPYRSATLDEDVLLVTDVDDQAALYFPNSRTWRALPPKPQGCGNLTALPGGEAMGINQGQTCIFTHNP